ncbi:hypothetical protein BD324DRAFT_632475 [Kockovaella imperatae]|uniref:Uncharacterized protein n=1 Tax=Kockovaella imperatae TaxID=4999 RepID=A0A1Y1UBG0_9TREE|nr:hypothetical protein BD324DRAFT_632475 [Kockovaella imperatae]ORX35342.1 hypothetical protein BD324DRAFT_632475 [Kockovaella imperatae]
MTDATPTRLWVDDIPTFQGLFAKSGNSLLRPFSLFSLFRSSGPSRPPATLLRPLHLYTAKDETGHQALIKPLLNLQSYSQQLKEYLNTKQDGPLDAEDVGAVSFLLDTLPIAIQATSIVWTWEGEWTQDVEDMRAVTRQCLEGVFVLRRAVNELDSSSTSLTEIDRKLLGSIFEPLQPTSLHPDEYLTMMFTRASQILEELVEAFRPKKHISSNRTSPLPTSRVSVSPEDVLEVLALLEILAQGMDTVESLSGPHFSKTKAQKEKDKQRPMRISMQARLLRCDLAFSMANGTMKDIQRRAVKRLDVTPGNDETEEKSIHNVEEEEEHQAIHWEEIAECSLLECLVKCKHLLEHHRGAVLSDRVNKADYLGQDPRRIPLPPSPRSPNANTVVPLPAAQVEDASDSDDSEVESDDALDTYPCPLRALFGLHDRYEEQRLAVWLTLPGDRRTGMGTYMRGEEGQIGEAWDAAGVIMLLDYDNNQLVSQFGLSDDKLDKWIDLASRKNAKKIRRKARRTV